MNHNNDISADYLRQQQEIQEADFMLLDELYKNHPTLLFCFFEGPDDINYYASRIRDYARCEFQEFYCDGKQEVIERLQYISRKTQTPHYNNAKIAYFVDKDFYESIYQSSEIENSHKIYETPCYSIENFYTSSECFKRITKEEFKIQQYLRGGQTLTINPDFENSVKRYEQKQQEFHEKIGLLNAYIACLIKNNEQEELNLKDKHQKLMGFFIIKLDRIESNYTIETLNQEFSPINNPSEQEINQQLDYLRSQDCQKSFRGKFEIEFLFRFLCKLIDDAKEKHRNQEIFSRQIKVKLNLQRDKDNKKISKNILSELSQYAETPDCLVQYLEQF